jgi:hypothetical protein
MGGGLTTPDAAAGVAGATASGLFNIRPLSIFTCHFNASVARGATIWKPIPGVVDIFFPKVVSVPRLPFLLHYLMRVCSIFLLFLGFRQPETKWTPLMIDCHATLFHQRRTVSLEFFFFFFLVCDFISFLPGNVLFFSSWQQLPRPGKKKSIQTNGSCESIK